MGRSCCVIGCNRRSHDSKGHVLNIGDSLFSFPTSKKVQGQHVEDITKRCRIAWVAAVRRKNITFANISRSMYVCGRHFLINCRLAVPGKWRRGDVTHNKPMCLTKTDYYSMHNFSFQKCTMGTKCVQVLHSKYYYFQHTFQTLPLG